MTTTLTIERAVHFQAQVRGRKELRAGPAPPGPPPDPGRVPRVSRLMALALRFEGLLQAGVVKDYAELARLGHVTRARVSQVMNLLSLGAGPSGGGAVSAADAAGPRPDPLVAAAADRLDVGLASAAAAVGRPARPLTGQRRSTTDRGRHGRSKPAALGAVKEVAAKLKAGDAQRSSGRVRVLAAIGSEGRKETTGPLIEALGSKEVPVRLRGGRRPGQVRQARRRDGRGAARRPRG